MGALIKRIGIPTFIVAAFLLVVLISAFMLGLSVSTLISDTLRRVGMNGLLVLAMVPAIKSGTGPNFALPTGIVCGLLALICCMEVDIMGFRLLIYSSLLAAALCVLAGWLYGKLLNAVKGAEMTIATYTGFSMVALFAIIWLTVPFGNKKMGWMLGTGLRETIQMDAFAADEILSKIWMFNIGGAKEVADGAVTYSGGITFPTGMLLFFLLCCLAISLFFKTKTGIAIYAGGVNPRFAEASGINTNRYRIIANIISTVLAGVGIIIYSQGWGYAQLYSAPLNMAFPAVAGVLIGGATASKATCINVVIGVCLFQGLLTSSLPVCNVLFPGTDLPEIMRMIIQNGVILYALTQVKGGGR